MLDPVDHRRKHANPELLTVMLSEHRLTHPSEEHAVNISAHTNGTHLWRRVRLRASGRGKDNARRHLIVGRGVHSGQYVPNDETLDKRRRDGDKEEREQDAERVRRARAAHVARRKYDALRLACGGAPPVRGWRGPRE